MTPVLPKLRGLAAEYNALNAELHALWEKEGNPPRAKWEKIAQPIWDRQEENWLQIAPLLFEWAIDERLAGRSMFSSTSYKEIRARTGLEANGHRIRQMLDYAKQEEAKRSLQDIARTMPDEEWGEYMESFCTTTPEGQRTKDFLVEARGGTS